jgi:hypothetical protein
MEEYATVKYYPVKYNRNWNSTVTLNDERFEDKDWVEILYPDGHSQVHRIDLRVHTQVESDHGNDWVGQHESIGFQIEYHGIPVWIKVPDGTMMRKLHMVE